MRWIAVWRRNFLVWRKLVIASVLTNLADPLILLFGLGYGLGALLPSVEGMSYIAFFAAGTLCSATMFTASLLVTVTLNEPSLMPDAPSVAVTVAICTMR